MPIEIKPSGEAARGNVLQRLGHLLRGIPFTRSQLFTTLREARQRNLLDDDTLQMMRRVVEVSDLQVEQVMVSRGQMVTVDSRQTLDDVLPVITESAHSRFPVTDGDKSMRVIWELDAAGMVTSLRTGRLPHVTPKIGCSGN